MVHSNSIPVWLKDDSKGRAGQVEPKEVASVSRNHGIKGSNPQNMDAEPWHVHCMSDRNSKL
jgi:hypothetical protein